jgi:hypothetical protein
MHPCTFLHVLIFETGSQIFIAEEKPFFLLKQFSINTTYKETLMP